MGRAARKAYRICCASPGLSFYDKVGKGGLDYGPLCYSGVTMRSRELIQFTDIYIREIIGQNMFQVYSKNQPRYLFHINLEVYSCDSRCGEDTSF